MRAAALLHDIGKLAVPEHIISKPGKLTPEEFEKMKIHPVVGAEILERVEFPYPVVPIVRSHHEKWDGTGYPDGLEGRRDSDRRAHSVGSGLPGCVGVGPAIPPRPAARRSDGGSGETRRARRSTRPWCRCWGGSTWNWSGRPPTSRWRWRSSRRTSRFRAAARRRRALRCPHSSILPAIRDCDFLNSIASARQEVHLLFELTQDLGSSLSIDETLSVVAARLKRLVPYDAIAAYVSREGRLVPEYVNGENFRLLSSLQIPIGEGVSGWVAQTGRTVVNGNPAVESPELADAGASGALRSALAVPLVGLTGTIGVLTLYRTDKDAFSADHLRVLLAVTSKVSLALENALKFRQVETTATTDYLTELPNARSLFLRLDSELARSKRANEPLTVLVCDLDGFKMVNDCHGHLVGNKVLRAVGNALRESCREYDYVARMGGDEFVLILPASDRDSMQQRIEELREIGGAAGVRGYWHADDDDEYRRSVLPARWGGRRATPGGGGPADVSREAASTRDAAGGGAVECTGIRDGAIAAICGIGPSSWRASSEQWGRPC